MFEKSPTQFILTVLGYRERRAEDRTLRNTDKEITEEDPEMRQNDQ